MRHRRALLALVISTLSCGDNVHHDIGTLIVSPQLALYTDEGGEAATFTISLSSPPSEDVVVTIDSHDTTEGLVSPTTLTFTAENFFTAQTITVTGVDDRIADGDRQFHVVVDAGGRGTADLVVTNGDDDVVGIAVSPIVGLTTSESGATAMFSVSLTSEPGRDVTVPVVSSDPTEGVTSVTELVFTPVRYGPVAVVVTGVPDVLADGDVAYSIVLGPATSIDGTYNGFDADDVQVTNTDDVAATISVTPTSGLVVSEAATTATFDVVLLSQPTSNVTIAVTSSDTSEATVGAASLVFTNANWNTPQTVTVTGVNDALDDGDQSWTITLGAATSNDPVFSGIDPSDVTGTTTDNDGPGVSVTPTSGLSVTEAGTTATFSVVLQSQPTASVTIPVTSSDTSEATVSTATLAFTTGNWNTPQIVTVTGVNDVIDDGDVAWTITLGAATSTDGGYAGFDPSDVTGTTIDNDGAGVTVTPTSGLSVSETGTTTMFTVVLQSQPTASVSIPVTSSDTTEATVSTATLTFTTGNWNTPQPITVTGVDDAIDDGNVNWTITLGAATSTDTGYAGFDPTDVTGTTVDNDTASFTVTPTTGLVTTESGGTATFTVRLNSQPTASVTIGVSSSDTGEGTVVPTSLVFDGTNWMTPQTVTVTGVDDAVGDGAQAYTIVLAAATSTDAVYSGLNPTDVSVSNTDNDVAAGFVLTSTTVEVSEFRDAENVDVSLTRQPTANVTITVTSSDTTEATVSPTTLTFTPANWATPQTITITGADDNIGDGPVAFTIVTSAATSADAAFNGLNPPDITGTNFDNDTATVYVKARSSLFVTEGGSTTTFRVRLTVAPTATVTCPVLSSDTTEGTVSPASLVFQPNSFGFQTVTITGVDDALADGDTTFTIALGACSSTDLSYNGSNPRDVFVVNRDDE